MTITIDDLGNNGEGIGHVDGYALFVKGALPGEVVKVSMMKCNKNYGFAQLLEIVEPSPERVTPVCPAAGKCGGCTLQHLSYEGQLVYKDKKVKDCLTRIGGVDLSQVEWQPIQGMTGEYETPWHYRNKAQFPIRRDDYGKAVMGFFAGRSHRLIPMDCCEIQDERINQTAEVVLDFLNERRVPAYDEASHTGLVRHLFIRVGKHTGQIMVCLVLNGSSLPEADKLVEKLLIIPGMTSIFVNINTEKTNVILGKKMKLLWGKEFIEDQIGDISYEISPQSFYQVNPIQTEKLYQSALDFAELTGEESVWDLYCGIGTISLFLARKAKEVYGVEIVPQAIDNARINARKNGIQNVHFSCGAAEDVAQEQGVDVIVVDPPRKGCDSKLLDTMVTMAPKKIVYVSCDPATLARDVKILSDKGYQVKKVRVTDMFPMGGHVETVVLLSQQKPDDYAEVELELDGLDLTSAESKATYKEIQEYVLKEHGLKVSNLYIAQVKRKCGIEVGENYNLPKSEDSRQPQCPVEKEKAIKDALEHFGMI